jgi:hydroxymethylbilane synthase
LRARPDLAFCGLRGNVETRLAKIRGGEADATFLALAGLNRLGIHLDGAEILDDETWLPALCQGAIGLEARAGDTRVQGLVSGIDHPASHLAVICERAFLAALNGSCRTPIAGLARLAGNRLEFRGEVLRRDGRDSWTSSRATDVLADPIMARRAAALMGASAASDIKSMAGADMPHF